MALALGEEAAAARARHQQMLSVAKTDAAMDELAEEMRTIGWHDVHFEPLTNKDDIIGWIFTASA